MVYVYPYILSWLSRSPHISRRKALQAKSGHTRKRKKQEEIEEEEEKKNTVVVVVVIDGNNKNSYLAADKNYEEE